MLRTTVLALIMLGLAACSRDEGEADAGSFYQGENLSYIVATNAGGGYDAYARMISGYIEEYLGVDHVVIRNVPGAGHIVGANTLWRADPDGLTIGTFNSGLIYGQLIGMPAIRFDLAEFAWVGKAAGEPRAVVVSESCHIRSMQDLMAAENPVRFASAGVGSASHTDARLLAEALDLDIELISGYGGQEGEMAMLRGELCGLLGSASSLEDFISSGYGNVILTIGSRIEGVPAAMDFAETERAKRIISLIDMVAQLGRITAAPPGTPPERLEQLRAAYKAALNDPDLLAEAEQAKRPIDPAYGEDVHQMVADALQQDADVVAIITESVGVAGQ